MSARSRKLLARCSSLFVLLALSRAAGSSISVTDVPLREIVAKSQLIVLAKVERIDSAPYPNAKEDEPELRFASKKS